MVCSFFITIFSIFVHHLCCMVVPIFQLFSFSRLEKKFENCFDFNSFGLFFISMDNLITKKKKKKSDAHNINFKKLEKRSHFNIMQHNPNRNRMIFLK